MHSFLRTWLHSSRSHAIARGLALFVGAFATLSLVGQWRAPGFDANLWWIDLRVLPDWSATVLIGALAVMLVTWSLGRQPGRRFPSALLTLLAVFIAAMLANAVGFWTLLAQGRIHSLVPLPLSLLFAGGLLFIAGHVPLRRDDSRRHGSWQIAACVACGILFPLLQVVAFGKTDYRKPAEAAVVFGARAYADGRPSDALADRVRTACQLYHDGLVRRLIFSGGPGDGAVHETESMRRLALQLGVPDTAVVRDDGGLSTAATIRNTPAFVGGQPILVVSEFYHLPRIKLACERAGLNARTVPARPSHWARAWPLKSMAREVPAFWYYFARAVFNGR